MAFSEACPFVDSVLAPCDVLALYALSPACSSESAATVCAYDQAVSVHVALCVLPPPIQSVLLGRAIKLSLAGMTTAMPKHAPAPTQSVRPAIWGCARRVPSDWSVPFDDAKIEEKELAGAEPCHDAVMGL